METLWQELIAGIPDVDQLARIVIRLLVAAMLGAIIGYQRERVGKPAGLRTHILVASGAAMFMLAAPKGDDLSRVIQGVATGVGFIGAGAILKRTDEKEIHGITSAAAIWATAAVGVAAGDGRLGVAIVGVVLMWLVLAVIVSLERRIAKRVSQDESKLLK
jgi:putative Mg2+ transporter-C (MgtC) family protein